jgi:hypothetical protein
VEEAHNIFKINNLRREVYVTISEASETCFSTSARDLQLGGSTGDQVTAFYQRHPKVARDLLYILEVYKGCPRVPQTSGLPDLERVYVHVFGSASEAACDRCNPAFYREKLILGAPPPR